MDMRFLPHNSHWDDPHHFADRDPQLRQLKSLPYVYSPPLLHAFPQRKPGIYTLGGGRQVGKTTLLKQWMWALLKNGVKPKSIAFFSGELIDDHHTLLRLMQEYLNTLPATQIHYLLIDEVTYIKEWDKAIKYAADSGLLVHTVLMLTGSDLSMIQEARMRFPGRRGHADIVDFHYYPLSFKEVVTLKKSVKHIETLLRNDKIPSPEILETLYDEFQEYLIHGGYMTAINNYASSKTISPAVLNTYSDWIRGDMARRGKQEHYLREILGSVIKRYTSQVTWNALAKDLSIDHPKTVADYAALLEAMDALFVQPALLEDKLTQAPKKARKVMFTDPFIFHAIHAWISPTQNPFRDHILPTINDPRLCSQLVEAVVTTHIRRLFPTYYLKGEGEVDIAYLDRNTFWPIEIKWTNQIHPKDLKQLLKYKHARLLTKAKSVSEIQGISTEPLPWALLRIGI